MKNFEEILPLVFWSVVGIILFWGITTAILKTFRLTHQAETVNIDLGLKDEHRRIHDVQRLQKEHMRRQKQRIRDLQRDPF